MILAICKVYVIQICVIKITFEQQKLVNQNSETPAYMYFKSRKTQCLEINFLLIAHRQVFSEKRFGGIIANKGDLDLCDE